MKLLLVYASRHGSTAEVAEYMARAFEWEGFEVDLDDVETLPEVKAAYDAIVLGSAVHNGKVLPEIVHYVNKYHDKLVKKPVFLWVTCIRILEPNGRQHVLGHYIPQSELSGLPFLDTGVFAGKLDLDSTNWNEAWTLAVRYDGTTPPRDHDGDYRDWKAIEAWVKQTARSIDSLVGEARG
jgi:menaquinone-dependent protoporphyrinogen oxidase